jgi:hypothetical protein
MAGGPELFRKNDQHKQGALFSTVSTLPQQAKKRLESSWAHAFYHSYFCKIDETVFTPLYSNKMSRPNVPVNILLGFETLKSGLGLSDIAMYNSYLYDVQIRYALGISDLDDAYFDLRTIYNFRSALLAHEKETDISLVTVATQSVVKEQMEAFQIKGGLQRMDSTLVQSNIRTMSRLQLVISVIQRLLELVSPEQITNRTELFAPYQKEDAQHICYKVAYENRTSRLEQAGRDLYEILNLLKPEHKNHELWQQGYRVFSEHFTMVDDALSIVEPKLMSGGTLQSPHDPEATYRSKSNESSKGYVANLSETCDPDNPLQLITSIQVQANITDDQALLAEALPQLKADMGLHTLLTDGGYAGPVAAEALDQQGVTLKTSAIKGAKRVAGKLGLEVFTQESNPENKEIIIRCPQGYVAEIKASPDGTRMTAVFSNEKCSQCPQQNQCPAKRIMRKSVRIVQFTKNSLRIARTRKIVQEEGREICNKRASIESTVRSVIHAFGGHLCKLTVRGRKRVRDVIQLSAMMVNIRRIAHYMSNNEANMVIIC